MSKITKTYDWTSQTIKDFKKAGSEIKDALKNRKKDREKYFGTKKK